MRDFQEKSGIFGYKMRDFWTEVLFLRGEKAWFSDENLYFRRDNAWFSILVPIIMSVSIDTNLNFNSKHISCTLIQKKTKPHSHTKNKIFIIFFKNNGISGDFSHIKCKSWYKRFTLSMHHRVIGKNCCQFGKRRKVSSFDNKISTSTPKTKNKICVFVSHWNCFV